MKAIAKDTGKVVEFSIEDKNGIDYTTDCVGNAGGLHNGSGSFYHDSDKDVYYIDTEESLIWWSRWVDGEQRETYTRELFNSFGLDDLYKEIYNCRVSGYDLEDQAISLRSGCEDALNDGEVLEVNDIDEDLSIDILCELKEIWKGYEAP